MRQYEELIGRRVAFLRFNFDPTSAKPKPRRNAGFRVGVVKRVNTGKRVGLKSARVQLADGSTVTVLPCELRHSSGGVFPKRARKKTVPFDEWMKGSEA